LFLDDPIRVKNKSYFSTKAVCMEDCVFCSILSGKIPSKKLYEDDVIAVIEDIHPAAAKHFLIITKAHYSYLSDMNAFDAQSLGIVLRRIPEIVKKLGITNGYRLIINQGEDAGQTVKHIHIHILGGEKLGELN
jgi:histidine triad (HIT) family protein